MCDATCFELLPDHYGQYIPQEFAQRYADQCDNVEQTDLDILLAGPEHPDYWDVWNTVEQTALLHGLDGTRYSLFQNQNLYAITERAIRRLRKLRHDGLRINGGAEYALALDAEISSIVNACI